MVQEKGTNGHQIKQKLATTKAVKKWKYSVTEETSEGTEGRSSFRDC